jgi:hypothetical protein
MRLLPESDGQLAVAHRTISPDATTVSKKARRSDWVSDTVGRATLANVHHRGMSLVPAGRDEPLWWTLRRPFRALTYDAS